MRTVFVEDCTPLGGFVVSIPRAMRALLDEDPGLDPKGEKFYRAIIICHINKERIRVSVRDYTKKDMNMWMVPIQVKDVTGDIGPR